VAATPVGYRVFQDTADRFRIAVPSAWTVVNPDAPGGAQDLQRIISANPTLSSSYGDDAAGLVASGIKFWAFDLGGGSGYVPNVNVLVKSAPGTNDSDLPGLVKNIQSSYQRIGARVVSSGTISYAGHKAYRVLLQVPLAASVGGAATTVLTLEVFLAHGHLYDLNLAGGNQQFLTIASTFTVS
jgi:hypothetical protein